MPMIRYTVCIRESVEGNIVKGIQKTWVSASGRREAAENTLAMLTKMYAGCTFSIEHCSRKRIVLLGHGTTEHEIRADIFPMLEDDD